MNKRLGVMTGTFLSGAAVVLLVGSQASSAGDDEKAKKEQQEAMLKIAEVYKTNREDGAKQAAAFGAKLESLEHVMHGLKPRSKGGYGVGKKKGEVLPDGIELRLQDLQRDGISDSALKKQGEALEEMAYRLAALGEATKTFKNFKAVKGMGGTKKDWQDLSEKMAAGSLKLADAIKAKGAAEIKIAAVALWSSCTACHPKFRE